MKKYGTYILLAATALFAVFTAGFLLGRNSAVRVIAISQPTETTAPAAEPTAPSAREAPAAEAAAGEATVDEVTEETDTAAEEPTGGLVNINTASLSELTTLPGIGPVIGQRILDYRQAHGPFEQFADLLQVSGIGENRLEALLPLITLGG